MPSLTSITYIPAVKFETSTFKLFPERFCFSITVWPNNEMIFIDAFSKLLSKDKFIWEAVGFG